MVWYISGFEELLEVKRIIVFLLRDTNISSWVHCTGIWYDTIPALTDMDIHLISSRFTLWFMIWTATEQKNNNPFIYIITRRNPKSEFPKPD